MFADSCIGTMDEPTTVDPSTLHARFGAFLDLFTLVERLDILTHLQATYLAAFSTEEQPKALADWLSTDPDYQRLAERRGWN